LASRLSILNEHGAWGKQMGPDRQGAIDTVFTIQVQFPEGRADALIGANSSRS
jgi:hypothetical protein